jgi:hypothetical protein
MQAVDVHPGLARHAAAPGDRGPTAVLTARMTPGHGLNAEVTDTPPRSPRTRIDAKYLAAYLAAQDRALDASHQHASAA